MRVLSRIRLKRAAFLLSIAVLGGMTAGMSPAEDGQGKILRCGLAKSPPKIDGVLDDSCWTDAGRTDDFNIYLPPSEKRPLIKTTVLACADHDALYIGFDCEEPEPGKLTAKAGLRDGAELWRDDLVEIFINTGECPQTFYQVAVNPKGGLFDQDSGLGKIEKIMLNEAWNGPIEAAARIGKDRWTVEVKICLSGLRLSPSAGGQWKANFARTRKAGGTTQYVWANVGGGQFGDVERFGALILPFDPTENAVTGVPVMRSGRVFWNSPLPGFNVFNRKSRPAEVRLGVKSSDEDRLGDARGMIPPGTNLIMSVTCILTNAGRICVQYELNDDSEHRTCSAIAAGYTVSQPLEELSLANLLFYQGESIKGRWRLGIDPERYRGYSNVLMISSTNEQILITESIQPKSNNTNFSLDESGKLPEGSYKLCENLVLSNRTIASTSVNFRIINNPFGNWP